MIVPILGAAVQAAMITGKLTTSQSKTIKLTDVIPLSLGTNIIGGITCNIIPRNSQIPATFTENFTTARDNQTSCDIKLLEGERTMSKNNNLLGEMKLEGIPPMPRETPSIKVTFSIDANGTLFAKAVEDSTGKSTETSIEYGKKRLNESDMRKMIDDAQRLRLDDQKKLEDAQARNELEFYCLDLQSEVRQNSMVIGKCRTILDWLNDGHRDKESCRAKKRELEILNRDSK